MQIRFIKNELQEMANISKDKTGLSYDIWLDSVGKDRKVSHRKPRLKVRLDNKELIPVSIEREPKILVKGKEIPKFRQFKKFILLNYDILMKHWNLEIEDDDVLDLIKSID